MIDIDYVLELLQAVETKMKTTEALWKLGFDAYYCERQEWISQDSSKGRIAVSRRCFRSGLRTGSPRIIRVTSSTCLRKISILLSSGFDAPLPQKWDGPVVQVSALGTGVCRNQAFPQTTQTQEL